MNTVADPNREPSFTFFGNPNFFFETTGSTTPTVGTGFAWNHGDIQPEIARTFIGIVGPGVEKLGVTEPSDFFTDHVDLRPTMMTLLGVTDDYQHDGRAILELLDKSVLPSSLDGHRETLLNLGQVYKQINAPFGQLSESALTVSTYAITSTSTGDVVYNNLENQITAWTLERDGLASQIKSMLEGAEFSGEPIDEKVVVPDPGLDAGVGRPALNHPVGVLLPHGVAGQRAGQRAGLASRRDVFVEEPFPDFWLKVASGSRKSKLDTMHLYSGHSF